MKPLRHEVSVPNTNPAILAESLVKYGGYPKAFFGGGSSAIYGSQQDAGDSHSWITDQYTRKKGSLEHEKTVMIVKAIGPDKYEVEFLVPVNFPPGKSLDEFIAQQNPQAQQPA
jgi:hypothetical protein